MTSLVRSRALGMGFVAALGAAAPHAVIAQSTIPTRIADKEFWQLNASFSEPCGSFRSENFLSNETGFQFVVPELQRRVKPGGVYLGVGPEQNFTYIVALQPKIAIIFDIRRGNMIEHLMYKALIEMSNDRATFLSKLFSRARPVGLDTNSTPQQLFDAYTTATADSVLFRKNLAAIKEHLIKTHGFALSDNDSNSLDYIYSAFFGGGPEINYSSPSRGGRGTGFGRLGMPTYASLQVATDAAGKNWAYLATEANFRWLKDFESRNLLVPVVGNFAGPKAIRAVADYLNQHHATVSAFYTSNVEQYLFQQSDDWSRYYENVAALPLDSASTFIRSIAFGRGSGGLPAAASAQQARLGGRLPSVISSMQELIKAFKAGRIASYADVIAMSR